MEYLPDRGLEQGEVLRFGTCNYIQEHHNIILLGATGSGKTHLACALGMAAERRFFAVKYIRCPDLLVEFQIATDLLEIVESRYKRNSTIFCSQFDILGWRSKLSNLLLEDTICDRIVHDAYTVVIGGKGFKRSCRTSESQRVRLPPRAPYETGESLSLFLSVDTWQKG